MSLATNPDRSVGALAGVRVLDCTDELGAYGPHVLALLGADVLRVVDVTRPTGIAAPEYDIYINACKRVVSLDPLRAEHRIRLADLAAQVDIVVETTAPSLLETAGLSIEQLCAANPGLVHTRISPLGSGGPDAAWRASDLTLMARSGLMWLAGDPDLAPVRPAGHQSAIGTGLYGAIGSLLALRHAEGSGEGQRVEVAALEVIATALENSVQYWDLERTIRGRVGSRPREAGSGLFRCRDGLVYVMAGRLTTPRGWVSIVEWLNEAGVAGANELQAPQWRDYAYRTRPDATEYFTELFTRFAAARSKLEIYEEGQRRGIVICPLNRPADLLEDRQLEHRHFFVPQQVDGREVLVPRGPFVMSRTALRAPVSAVRLRVSELDDVFGKDARHAPAGATGVGSLPLAGIRVADFTWVGAGPFATKMLADHGAEVIKIESAGRLDALRTAPPFRDRVAGVNRSGYFANRNTSKKSLALNMRDPRGVALARRLIAASDIVANSFSPGTMEKWGLGYAECLALRDDIIYLSMPMHGADGPHRQFLGYGAAIGALSGLFAATGYPGRDPVGTGTNYPDHVPNPCHAVLAMLAALRHRRRTGEGQAIELSQVESTVCALGPLVLGTQLQGLDRQRPLPNGNREPGVAPHGVFPALGEDRWIALACWSDRDWLELCNVAGREWQRDARFASLTRRIENEDGLESAIAGWTRAQDPFELAQVLQRRGIDAAPVQHARDVLEVDAQLRHARHWVRLRHAEMGDTVYNAPPIHLSSTPGALRTPAPLLGEHTDEVATTLLGLGQDEIDHLRAEGVFA